MDEPSLTTLFVSRPTGICNHELFGVLPRPNRKRSSRRCTAAHKALDHRSPTQTLTLLFLRGERKWIFAGDFRYTVDNTGTVHGGAKEQREGAMGAQKLAIRLLVLQPVAARSEAGPLRYASTTPTSCSGTFCA